MEKEEYEAQIKALKEEIELLKKKQTYEIKRQKYGLNWIDVPEAFEKDSENKIPVLEEVKDKSIKNDDGKPTHILIEGDNYHALQCLNYTHKGKVDVIYIDPPYNTGSGFRYKDKRFIDKYPDGTNVDLNSPLRHSYWLSFMSKRLSLSKKLLSNNGIIYISIDDNELYSLKLLCDSIFDESNFIGLFPRSTSSGEKTSIYNINTNQDYVLTYCKNSDSLKKSHIIKGLVKDFKEYSNPDNDPKGPWKKDSNLIKIDAGRYGYARYGITNPKTGVTYYPPVYYDENNRKQWHYVEDTFNKFLKEGKVIFESEERKNGYAFFIKKYLSEAKKDTSNISSLFLLSNEFQNGNGTKELKEIFNIGNTFPYAKPTTLIQELEKIISNKNLTILDFFAGSGTTLHATMKLNEEDGGNRQCILVQLNENNICEEVTYERNRRVMQGYTNSKGEQIPGLGNSLKYYKTAFIGQNNCKNANDDDRTELAKKAGCLLSLGENTLDEICSTEYYQLFTGSKEATAVYFTDDYEKFDEFKEMVAELAPKFKKTFVYIFAWSSADDFAYEFENIPNIQIKAIPLPILEIYKSIYNA